jgi:hypothetical protein
VCWCAAAKRELDAAQSTSSMRLSDSVAPSTFTCVSFLLERSAHRPPCIKTADLADRWARGRVDTHDENHALRALSTHKPAISKPAQTACSLSRGEVPKSAPDDAPFGCVGPYLALRTPLMSTPKRVSAVGSGLRASWAARRGAAGAGGAAGLVWRRCQIWKNGADLPGAELGHSMP